MERKKEKFYHWKTSSKFWTSTPHFPHFVLWGTWSLLTWFLEQSMPQVSQQCQLLLTYGLLHNTSNLLKKETWPRSKGRTWAREIFLYASLSPKISNLIKWFRPWYSPTTFASVTSYDSKFLCWVRKHFFFLPHIHCHWFHWLTPFKSVSVKI